MSFKIAAWSANNPFPVVINAASASHDRSAKALIEGLARRQKATGKESYLIHVSLCILCYRLTDELMQSLDFGHLNSG